MKEQQRFLFSRQSLFLVGEKEKLMIHFWADIGFFDRSQILGKFYPRDLSRGHKMVVKDQPVAKAS